MPREKFSGDPQAHSRYERLKMLGKKILGNSETVRAGTIADEDVNRAKQFIAQGTKETNPLVRASYWEHILIAPEFGTKIARQAFEKGLAVNPAEVAFLLWMHDIGRLVAPGDYLRTDFIGDRILVASGVPRKILKELPSVGVLMEKAEALELDEEQLRFRKPLTTDQEQIAKTYFDSLTPTQRIINFADNLGKRGPDGLFTSGSFVEYLRTQESRYESDSPWASVRWSISRRQAGAVLQAYTIERTGEWLEEIGVNLTKIHHDLKEYGPKFVVIVRHGELDNPTNIVYSRDNVMGESKIHLSEAGRVQMYHTGELLQERGFQIERIDVSPEIRADESAHALNRVLHVSDEAMRVNDLLDDTYAPGPFKEGMTLDELTAIGGDVYENNRWKEYVHERPEDIITRMNTAFWQSAKNLQTGQTAILVSHGDPIAWLVNTISGEVIPQPKDLRNLLYPSKGEGVVAIIGPDNKIFSLYSLGSWKTAKIY